MDNTIIINGKDIDVKQYRNDWALALMSQGIIVRISISRWRAIAPLRSDELGLKFSDQDSISFMKRYVNLGTEKLLPPNVLSEIAAIENKARIILNNFSFDTVWGHFVPFTAFNEWEAANDIIRNDFMEAAKKLGEKYTEIIQIVKEEYCKMAKDVWMRLYPDKGPPPDSFIENFSSQIVNKIPSKTNIVTSFKYDITYFIIPMPSLIEENINKARDLMREKENKDFASNLEQQTKKKIAGEYIKRKQELIDDFLDATVSSMRKYIADLCENVLLSLNQDTEIKDISKQQQVKIKKMIRKVNLLNFQNDYEIKKLLSDLETEVDKFKGERNKNIIVENLQKIVDAGSEDFIPKNFDPTIGFLDI